MADLIIYDLSPRTQYDITTSSTGPYAVPWAYYEDTDIVVVLTLDSDGIDTVLTQTQDYTVSNNAATFGNQTGSVTLTAAVENATLTIYRDSVIDRLTQFPTSGIFSIQDLNQELSRIFLILLEFEDELTRTIKLAETSSFSGSLEMPPPVALAHIGWNSTATGLANYLGLEAGNLTVEVPTVVDNIAVWGDTTGTTLKDGGSAAAALGVPAGTIMAFGGNSAPTGWLECDGSTISRTTYSALFAALGDAWGAGDGSTTFEIPDFRGEFLRGWDNGKGTDSGRLFATYQADEFENHTHPDNFSGSTNTTGDHTHTLATVDTGTGIEGGTGAGLGYSTLNTTSTNGDHSHTVTISGGVQTSTSGGTESRPRNYAVLYIIKT